ncbi:MAG: PEP-CTERM sorting domain-containing protein, partial [Planctomycetia bacterium]|nr:PEP-CTERM sorting domain-containing protein [Planctomycetia bacterium]
AYNALHATGGVAFDQVPEPGTWVLLLLGMGGMFFVRRRFASSLLVLVLCTGGGGLRTNSAFAETLTWNGSVWTDTDMTVGRWFDATNWLIGTEAAGRVPATGDVVNIASGVVGFHSAAGGEPDWGRDLNFTGTINLSGTGKIVRPTTHWTRFYGGEMTIADTAALELGAGMVFFGLGGTHSLTMAGGKLAVTNTAGFGYTDDHGTGGSSTASFSGGNASFGTTYIGYGVGSTGNVTISGADTVVSFGGFAFGASGTGTLEVSDGTVTLAGGNVGTSAGSGALKVSGGSVTLNGEVNVGNGAGSTGTLEISGGSVTFASASRIGYNGGTATISLLAKTYDGGDDPPVVVPGVLYAPSADFIIGQGNSNAKMIVDGGTYNQNGKGNFVIVGADKSYNDGQGTLLELRSGTIDTLWLSLGQAYDVGGLVTMNMTGGDLKVGSGSLRIGWNGTKADFNAHGGNVTVGGTLLLAGIDAAAGSQLNIYGSGSTWSAGTIDLTSRGVVNFNAGALEFSGGTPNAAVSTLVSTGNTTVAAQVNADMTGYVYSGVAFLSSVPRQTLVDATGTLSWNPSSVEITGPWMLDTSVTGEVALVIDDDQVAGATAGGYAYGDLGESGWLKITGSPNETTTIEVLYNPLGEDFDSTDFVAWLNNNLYDDGVEAVDKGGSVLFTNLDLGDLGTLYMSYDLSAYNALHATGGVAFDQVPEPGTWVLMLLGMVGLAFYRRSARNCRA